MKLKQEKAESENLTHTIMLIKVLWKAKDVMNEELEVVNNLDIDRSITQRLAKLENKMTLIVVSTLSERVSGSTKTIKYEKSTPFTNKKGEEITIWI